MLDFSSAENAENAERRRQERRFLQANLLVFEKNTNFVTGLSRQAHDREICLSLAVAISRRTLHCGETARFLPLFSWRYTTPPCLS